jgi:hypothetical protein
VTACIAAEISSTARSRHGGRIRSMQSRIAVGHRRAPVRRPCALEPRTPPRATLRQRASPCCGSRAGGRPGCPTGPSRTAARAPAPAVLVTSTSDMVVPLVRSLAHSRRRGRWRCYTDKYVVASIATTSKSSGQLPRRAALTADFIVN